jgi:quaternary ammonium compound-resistance protein SugE
VSAGTQRGDRGLRKYFALAKPDPAVIRKVSIMAWLYLILAGLFEIGWPVGLKMAQVPGTRWSGIGLAVVFMSMSGYLLWLAQRQIPLGTAYAVWTGIGAAGTFLVGVLYYHDPTSLARYLGVALIVAGVIVLKLAH